MLRLFSLLLVDIGTCRRAAYAHGQACNPVRAAISPPPVRCMENWMWKFPLRENSLCLERTSPRPARRLVCGL
jgi:hypothetical protein